ncbi:hypothetical protein GMST_31790 [Geomonas silvestris]|uniref:Uncharacterized protein n=1 Tax=Geomonas silvestris TaxID=2740184 RepID=A0A6V8MLQ3_9BACT|nr:hypothetical protein [Geomonas silvestris]GFO60854.1 hypothetical protein GMST_31790 [Geomonas silvestris]
MTQEVEGGDEIEELTKEIRKLIESNKQFLARVNDEDFDDGEEAEAQEGEAESDDEDFEEL